MAFAKFEGHWLKIGGEIAENHAILVDHFLFDGEYSYIFSFHNMIQIVFNFII